MKKPSVTFEPFDVVRLPFPYADRAEAVARPAIVLTGGDFHNASGTVLVAMVTSARNSSWPQDVVISDREAAGLVVPCVVRMKLNTIALGLIERKIGRLSEVDAHAVRQSLKTLLPFDK